MVVHQTGAETTVYPNRKAQSKSENLNMNTQTALCCFLINRGIHSNSAHGHILILAVRVCKTEEEGGNGPWPSQDRHIQDVHEYIYQLSLQYHHAFIA